MASAMNNGPVHAVGQSGSIMRDMKVYVVGYRQRRENEPLINPPRPWDNIDVQFSPKRGDWLMEYKEEAQRELDLMLSMRVHVGAHYCQLELDEEDGKYAIVCREHPEPIL